MQPCRQQRWRGDSLQANWRRQPTDRDDIAGSVNISEPMNGVWLNTIDTFNWCKYETGDFNWLKTNRIKKVKYNAAMAGFLNLAITLIWTIQRLNVVKAD